MHYDSVFILGFIIKMINNIKCSYFQIIQWARGLAVMTQRNAWAHSLVAMTSPLHGEGRQFESGWAHRISCAGNVISMQLPYTE